MKCYRTNDLLHILCIGIILLHTSVPAFSCPPDTLKVTATGENNRVAVGSQLSVDARTEITGTSVRGSIIQSGENNNVDINMKKDKPYTRKHECTDKKGSHSHTQLPAEDESMPVRQQIKITQTGKNNSVKINTH